MFSPSPMVRWLDGLRDFSFCSSLFACAPSEWKTHRNRITVTWLWAEEKNASICEKNENLSHKGIIMRALEALFRNRYHKNFKWRWRAFQENEKESIDMGVKEEGAAQKGLAGTVVCGGFELSCALWFGLSSLAKMKLGSCLIWRYRMTSKSFIGLMILERRFLNEVDESMRWHHFDLNAGNWS